MKALPSFILGVVLGFILYYAYDFRRAVNNQIQFLESQATVQALLPLCPEVFKNVVKPEAKGK